MKIKVTRNQLKNHYANIISIPYCELQNLLSYEDATFYNAGVYGWNYDAYPVNENCIITGYRTFGIPVAREIIATYDAKAKEIKQSKLTYSDIKAALHDLLVSFVQEVIDNNN